MERYINEYLVEHGIVKASNLAYLSEEEKAQITDGIVTKLYSSIKKHLSKEGYCISYFYIFICYSINYRFIVI